MEIELVNNEDRSYSCNECGVTNYDNPRKKKVDELYKFYIGDNRAGRIGVVMCEDCLDSLITMCASELYKSEVCGICGFKHRYCKCE